MIAAYCWPQSLNNLESIDLFCHTTATTFSIEIIRQGKVDQTVLLKKNLKGLRQPINGQEAIEGCTWDPSIEINISADWPSGFYLVKLEDSDGNKADAFFVVRSEEPSDLIFVLSTSTWNAYNTWGGQSLYTGGHVVSPVRPLQPGFLQKTDAHRHRIARFEEWDQADQQTFAAAGYNEWSMAAGWANWELLFARWVESQGYSIAYAVSQDLDQNNNLLDGYAAYLSVGHDEYWSAGMRNTVENFIADSGNAAFFSGNTAFWQVRFAKDYKVMTGYKCDIYDDPVYDPVASPTLSTMWSDPLSIG